MFLKKKTLGTSQVVQYLRLHAPNAGGLGSIPGQGTGSHKPQLIVCIDQLKIPHAAEKPGRLQSIGLQSCTELKRLSTHAAMKIKDPASFN